MTNLRPSASRETKKEILFCTYTALLVTVNVLGSKVSRIAGIRVSAGIMLMPLIFTVSDTVTECFGKRESSILANASVALLALVALCEFASINLPPDAGWHYQREYEVIFGQSLRMTIASLLSFFVSQKLDITLFCKIRAATGGRHLWVRNVASTALSQFADTIVFMFSAFWRITEAHTAAYVLSLATPYWILKMCCSWLMAPVCYLTVAWCGREPEPK